MPKAKNVSVRKTKSKRSEPLGFNLNKSYVGLLYGVATVIVIFVVVFLGLKANVNRNGSVSEDAAKTEQESMEENNSYTTVKGDTLWSIAEAKYNSGYNWVDIAKANNISNPSELEPGTKLTIPEVTPILIAQEGLSMTPSQIPTATLTVTPKPTKVTQAMEDEKKGSQSNSDSKITSNEYTVVKDDNLWTIAVRAYGDGFKWTEIAKANNLENPRIIHSGNVLKLPR